MPPRSPFLFLSEADMVAAGVDDVARSVDVADEVFRLLKQGDYVMGGVNRNSHGLVLVFPETSPFPNMPTAGPDRRVSAMPAYLGGRFDVCGVKWYGSNAENRKRGLPRSVLTVMLNDKSTGEPLALMAANRLSSSRTAAVPAVASRYLPAEPARVLAVVGCGEINRQAVRAILSQQPGIERIVCNNRSREKAEAFAEWLRAEYGVETAVAGTARECVAEADIVTVAASRTAPLRIEADWFTPHACILLSGPMQSDEKIWTESRVVYDHVPLHEAYVADARRADDVDKAYLGQIGGYMYRLIDAGKAPPLAESEDLGTIMAEERPPSRGRTVFIASGMAVFDVAWGFDLLESAKQKGLGVELELWGFDEAEEGGGSLAADETAAGEGAAA
ncbi:tyramine oxidase subunit B [Leucobacter sp. wl10]|uniref:tyramine oxidase subunit B n=1 Tax=Leucobacter sp. wl10 TaxID=2304677 RepID=UPI000E5A8900|nr:tyramine oxidase subunit B [Leucobacter sp. wl10]RGE22013.1 ornithine cyclodeaminase [Leucobacter sp. wl10]